MKSRKSLYHRHRFPSEIIRHTVWLYYRFCLSYRDVEDLLAQRGINVSYETVRRWCIRFGPVYANRLRRRSAPGGDQWFVDEVFVRIDGQLRYLYRAVDQDGQVLDILVRKRRDKKAATRFFRRLLKQQCQAPRRLVTDKLRSYRPAHREVMPGTIHDTSQYANNRAELSHEPTRQRERRMRRFKSISHAQRFLAVHATMQNLFAIPRHLLRAQNYRLFRTGAFDLYEQVTCA
jgi:putative transposase